MIIIDHQFICLTASLTTSHLRPAPVGIRVRHAVVVVSSAETLEPCAVISSALLSTLICSISYFDQSLAFLRTGLASPQYIGACLADSA